MALRSVYYLTGSLDDPVDIIGTQVLVIYPDNANGFYMFSWLANSGSSYFLSTLGREINWKDIFFTRLTGEFSFKQFRIYNLWAIEEAEVRITKYPHWWRMSEFNIYVNSRSYPHKSTKRYEKILQWSVGLCKTHADVIKI